MEKLFFRPQNAWVGDLIPYYEDGTFYAFYLHDPRCREEGTYAEETTWHLVTTKDLCSLEYHGEAIPRGKEDEPNANCYTGSVVRAADGQYIVFFTAFNEKVCIDGKAVQSVMRATGPDLYHLSPDPDFRMTADDDIYESFDWRDPYVFYNDEDACWWMILAARKKGEGALRGGCLALCKSDDLTHWTYEQPFFSPGMYVTMECPEVFRMGNWWYLVFSTFNDRFVTHYRIGTSPAGPWRIPENDAFDSRANYAIKTASDGQRRFAFGWIPSKVGNTDFGSWEWGGTMVIHEVVQDPDTGELTVKPIPRMTEFFRKALPAQEPETWNASWNAGLKRLEAQNMGSALIPVPEDGFYADIRFRLEEASELGIVLHSQSGLESGCFLKMKPSMNMMAMDQWPRCASQGRYQWQINGDCSFAVETMRPLPKGPDYRIRVFREDDICVIYVNDRVALSTRIYNHTGNCAGIYLVQGSVSGLEMKVYRR